MKIKGVMEEGGTRVQKGGRREEGISIFDLSKAQQHQRWMGLWMAKDRLTRSFSVLHASRPPKRTKECCDNVQVLIRQLRGC
jgi:hypothetical protein